MKRVPETVAFGCRAPLLPGAFGARTRDLTRRAAADEPAGHTPGHQLGQHLGTCSEVASQEPDNVELLQNVDKKHAPHVRIFHLTQMFHVNLRGANFYCH